MHRLVLLLLIIAAGCGRPPARLQLPAPDPDGCYLVVFDQVDFRGTGDVWNGPGRWSSLQELRRTRPDGWRNRIRSLRVGTVATLTVFTEPEFRGDSRQFLAESDHPQLDGSFSGRIESVQLTCK